jgi:hypothetical protein
LLPKSSLRLRSPRHLRSLRHRITKEGLNNSRKAV